MYVVKALESRWWKARRAGFLGALNSFIFDEYSLGVTKEDALRRFIDTYVKTKKDKNKYYYDEDGKLIPESQLKYEAMGL